MSDAVPTISTAHVSASRNSTLRPDALISVGGVLGKRFHANITGRIKDVGLSEQYIRWHEQKDHDDWFWSGEQLGKWLDSAVYSALVTNDQMLLDRVNELLQRLDRTQEADGYIGIVRSHRRTPVRGMQLYEWYYVLHGLLTCIELLQSEMALKIARRLAQFIVKTWGVEPHQFPLAGPYPGNGHDGGEGTLILEPIARLGQLTGDQTLIDWCEATVAKWDEWFDQFPQSCHTCGLTQMQRFAAGEIDADEMRENIHAHTLHMTLLGLAALYDATGNATYREIVTGAVNRLLDNWIFITGAMSTGERYVRLPYYHPEGEVEVCPQHSMLLLLHQLYCWTGDARYLDEIERDTFNHLLAAQLADGTNWSYMTPLNGQAQKPESSNCCNAAGMRILSRLPTYIYGQREGAPAVLLYTESEGQVSAPDLPVVRLRQSTRFPSDGRIELHVDPETPARFPLALRIPAYVTASQVWVNEEAPQANAQPGFLTLDRVWQPGDTVHIEFDFPIRCHANRDYAAVVRGPLVYAHFANGQPGYQEYFWHHPAYAGQTELVLDPANPAASVTECDVAEELLGPGLWVSSHALTRAPLFTSAQTNEQLALPDEARVLLLPFMNQGSIQGDYEVFKRYRLPT